MGKRGKQEKSDSSVLRDVDESARNLASELLRDSVTGALGTLDPTDGAPFSSLTTVATMMDGSPIILISELSTHTQGLHHDPRCSLLLSRSGAGDPLAHPRITVTAQAHFLSRDSTLCQTASQRFLRRHPKANLYAGFADFSFVLLKPIRASLNGGFGKAFALTPSDFLIESEQLPEFESVEADAIAHMNEDHAQAVQLYATVLAGKSAGHWQLTGIDPTGIDLLDGQQSARVWFDPPLSNPDQIQSSLRALAQEAREKSANATENNANNEEPDA